MQACASSTAEKISSSCKSGFPSSTEILRKLVYFLEVHRGLGCWFFAFHSCPIQIIKFCNLFSPEIAFWPILDQIPNFVLCLDNILSTCGFFLVLWSEGTISFPGAKAAHKMMECPVLPSTFPLSPLIHTHSPHWFQVFQDGKLLHTVAYSHREQTGKVFLHCWKTWLTSIWDGSKTDLFSQ